MNLSDIEAGTEIFIDANIFIYHFTGVSDECSDFLNRCEHGEIIGITSVNVLLEVLHRLMMVEAVGKNLVKPPNIAKKLKNYPEKIKQLNEYATNTRRIIEMSITVKPMTAETMQLSHSSRINYGLMVNDSLIVANMLEEGVTQLASNDEAFSKIQELVVFKPGDVGLMICPP